MSDVSTGKQIMGTFLLFSFFMICVQKVISGKSIIESFINYPRAIMINSVNPRTRKAVFGNNQSQLAPPVFTVPGTQQSALSPRFSSTGYGANITYNLPEAGKLGVQPNNPLQLSPMQLATAVKDQTIIEKDMRDLKETFNYGTDNASAEYQNLQQNIIKEGQETSAGLPIQNMATASSSGGAAPLMMDRFMIANMKSYRYNQGDMIRGDLPILPVLPNANPNSCTWFRPSVNPATDLNPGALAVLGGAFNDSNRQLIQLQMQANSGSLNTFGGTVWEPPANTSVGQQLIANATMAAQKTSVSTQGAPHGDVQVDTTPMQAIVSTFP